MRQKANSHFKWSVFVLDWYSRYVPHRSILGPLLFLIDKQLLKWSVVYFNETPENSTGTHKHLGKRLDSKLNYENHLQSVFSRVDKTIGILRKFQPTLPRNFLVTICKSFIRPHLDYRDIIYNWASNELNLFNKALELE